MHFFEKQQLQHGTKNLECLEVVGQRIKFDTSDRDGTKYFEDKEMIVFVLGKVLDMQVTNQSIYPNTSLFRHDKLTR